MKHPFSRCLLGLCLLALGLEGAERPNLIVILADDLCYADVGFNGCEDIPTPHIDRIAAEGVRFSSAYVTYPVCGPSRAGLITGRYPQRFGFERNPQYRPGDPQMGVPLSEETLADVLKKVGYTSGVVGKWHLGAHASLHPLERGFDFFFGHLGGGHRYLPEELVIRRSEEAEDEWQSYRTWILRDHEPVAATQYLTDEFSDAAVEFIHAHPESPFFLFLSYNAPHAPLQATERYLARFPEIENPRRRTYAAMVSAVDDGVGRVLEALRELDLEEDTLVVFLSDNGGPEAANASDNGPLRGGKGDVWEGGFRVPMALRYPAAVKAGKTFSAPVSALDIFATIAALSDAPIAPARPLDGVNLLPFLTGDHAGSPHEAIYLRKFDQQQFALRGGDFKLVIPERGTAPKLFRPDQDLGETRDLAAAHPAVVSDLQTRLDAWTAELIDPVFLGLMYRREAAINEKKKKQNTAP